MSRSFLDITFTPTVQAMQTRMGSRSSYARMGEDLDDKATFGREELGFIAQQDGFYQASVSETGWPYVQFRGGPIGFLKALDKHTIAYADFRGNKQYISVGNVLGNNRVSLILMDYANQRRLKLLGHAKLVEACDDPALMQSLAHTGYKATIERACVISIVGFNWNCPQHITQRFTAQEFRDASYFS
jgi:uncharacterized protein